MIDEYITKKQEQHRDMHKPSQFNIYCNEILNDVDKLVDEVSNYDYFDEQDKELITTIVSKLCNICCDSKGDLIPIIKKICE